MLMMLSSGAVLVWIPFAADAHVAMLSGLFGWKMSLLETLSHLGQKRDRTATYTDAP